MSDPVLAIALVLAFFAVMAAVRHFKTLDGRFWAEARTPLLAGLAAGVLIRLIDSSMRREDLHIFLVGVLLTLAALYVRLTGDESEPADGMLLGSLIGAAAAVPFILTRDDACRSLAEAVLAGAVAGYGITSGAMFVSDRLKQFLIDVVTAAVAIAAAWAPRLVRLSDQKIAIGVTAALPILVIVAAFKQWPDVRAELSHEASLGFIDSSDVRRTAHPLLRLGRGGWADAGAHRKFVRLANEIALRKRQQRSRPDDVARLYQLEIIKLRMQIQEMANIDRATRRQLSQNTGDSAREEEGPSDTMADRG